MKLPDVIHEEGKQISILLRHAEREEIPAIDKDIKINLTAAGKLDAFNFGRSINKNLGSVFSSPIIRCVQTASHIVHGSNMVRTIITEKRLGGPGVWVSDNRNAFEAFSVLGIHEIVKRQITGFPIQGIRDFKSGMNTMLDLLFNDYRLNLKKSNIFITHDAVIAPLVGFALNTTEPELIFPRFLESAIIIKNADSYELIWRDTRYLFPEIQ